MKLQAVKNEKNQNQDDACFEKGYNQTDIKLKNLNQSDLESRTGSDLFYYYFLLRKIPVFQRDYDIPFNI